MVATDDAMVKEADYLSLASFWRAVRVLTRLFFLYLRKRSVPDMIGPFPSDTQVLPEVISGPLVGVNEHVEHRGKYLLGRGGVTPKSVYSARVYFEDSRPGRVPVAYLLGWSLW